MQLFFDNDLEQWIQDNWDYSLIEDEKDISDTEIDSVITPSETPPNSTQRFNEVRMIQMKSHFCKYAWASAFAKKESNNVAQFLLQTFLVEGAPDHLQHDNGGEFISQVMQDLLKIFKVKDIRISPYSPSTDGQVERPNGTINGKSTSSYY